MPFPQAVWLSQRWNQHTSTSPITPPRSASPCAAAAVALPYHSRLCSHDSCLSHRLRHIALMLTSDVSARTICAFLTGCVAVPAPEPARLCLPHPSPRVPAPPAPQQQQRQPRSLTRPPTLPAHTHTYSCSSRERSRRWCWRICCLHTEGAC